MASNSRSTVRAVETETADPDAPFGRKADGTPKKRRGSSGPRTNKPIHVVFNVTDESGQPIQGAKLSVLYAGKSSDSVIEAIESNPGAQRTKVTV